MNTDVTVLGYFDVHLDGGRLGMGRRRVVAYMVGRGGKVHLLDPATLKHITFSKTAFDGLVRDRIDTAKPLDLARRIERKRREFRRIKKRGKAISFADDNAKVIASGLRAAAAATSLQKGP